MLDLLAGPWPWYVSGSLIGLMVPLLLLLTGKPFGVSSSLRHICAATVPRGIAYFSYDWKRRGAWSLTFVAGVFLGGIVAGTVLANPNPIAIAEATRATLSGFGLTDLTGLVPRELISWSNLGSVSGLVSMVLGGVLLGFGARYAGGCTSGHGITGLATLQKASLVAVIGFFLGGLFISYFVLPHLL